MSNGRHSYVAFYPSDWLGGTARLSRLHKSVFFDVCCYNWDMALPCPAIELAVMVGDLKNGMRLVEDLIAIGKLIRNDDGSVENSKALHEANKAMTLHAAKSAGGKASKTVPKTPAKSVPNTPAIEPEPEPEVSDKSLTPTQRVVSAWNDMAKKAGLPGASPKPIAKRDTSIKQRIGEHGVDAILAGFVTVPQSKFLMGGGNTGWRANLNDMLRPANMAKLIDGSYHTEAERASLGAAAKTLEERIAWFEEQAALMERIKNFDTAKSFMASAAELRAQQAKENENG